MFKQVVTRARKVNIRIFLTVALVGCLVWLALTFFRRPVRDSGREMRTTSERVASDAPKDAPRKLEGDGARSYLEQTSEGQSLMKALAVERFGLKWQKQSPFKGDDSQGAQPSLSALSAKRETEGGYLGLSHDENLNAWFDEQGATIRPTVSEKERANAWRLEMTLKSYGYGDQLNAAPPIVSRNVKESRIEYVRDGSANPQSAIRNPQLTEWYVNKSEGIEQGFTLNEQPARGDDVAEGEPLRLVVSVAGDLRAHAAEGGQSVELSKGGNGVLSYGHLVAADASGESLRHEWRRTRRATRLRSSWMTSTHSIRL